MDDPITPAPTTRIRGRSLNSVALHLKLFFGDASRSGLKCRVSASCRTSSGIASPNRVIALNPPAVAGLLR
jgi:hypothetical protein